MRSGKDGNSTRGRDGATADDQETAKREFAEASDVVEREIASQSRDDTATERSEIADERDLRDSFGTFAPVSSTVVLGAPPPKRRNGPRPVRAGPGSKSD
jgi:hypothetical protein